MFNIKYLFICMLALTTITSCKKALETKGHSFLSPTTFYNNEADAEAALNGAFTHLFSQDFYSRSIWLVSDLSADIYYNVINNADRSALFLNTYTASNGQIAVWWSANYVTIKNANDVIKYVPDIDMNETRRNNIVGNARFLRALCYYNLAISFGDVPVITTPGIDTLFPARSPLRDVYALIIDDLRYAEQHCYHTADLPEAQIGRVTSEAATTLLAKVYLQKASSPATEGTDNANALTACDKVISYSESHSSVLALEETFSDIFDSDKKNGKEVIFNVQFGNPPNANNIINLAFDPVYLGGYGSYHAQDRYYNSFAADDIIRRTENVGFVENGAHKISKYHDPGVSPGTFGRTNWIILRYADVLLMQSEAMHKINPSNPAKLAGINKVRARAQIGALGMASVPGNEAFVTALLNERAWEFCVEGHRRWDLIRLGRYQAVQQSLGHNSSAHRLLFPIPQVEIDVNKNLVQNQGY